MLDKKEKAITVLIRICHQIAMRNGEGGRGKGGATMNVPFTIARCQEIMPKIDKLRNKSVLLSSMQENMREKAKQGLKWLSVDSRTEGEKVGRRLLFYFKPFDTMTYCLYVLLFESIN